MNDFLPPSYYMAAFIDLQGQKPLLEELAKADLEDISEERMTADLSELMDKTFGAISDFHDSFQTFANASNTFDPTERHSVPSASHPFYMQLAALDQLKIQDVSDAVIVYARLEHPLTNVAVNSIFRTLYALALMTPRFLAKGHPFRGGIDIHWASEIETRRCVLGADVHKDNFVYGPAPYNAYILESEIAKYPRIVIDQNLIKRLRPLCDVTPRNSFEETARNHARSSRNLITTDEDKNFILDYLGDALHSIIGNFASSDENKQIFLTAYEKAKSFRKEFCQKGKSDLVERYERLIEYYRSRSHIWEKDGIKFD